MEGVRFARQACNENAFCAATAVHGSVALPFVIPSVAEGSAVPRTIPGNVFRQSVAEWSDLRFNFTLPDNSVSKHSAGKSGSRSR
jgi:hypothetical protein